MTEDAIIALPALRDNACVGLRHWLSLMLGILLYCLPAWGADLWADLRKEFRLPNHFNHPEVRAQIKFFMDNPRHLQKLAESAQPYLYYVLQELKKRKLPGEFALLPMIESAYDPYAHSIAGATGLWQLMPGTGSGLGVKLDWWYDGRRDIPHSTKAALNYLTYLGEFFNHDWLLAIAAYDAGQGAVRRAQRANLRDNKRTDFWSLNLPRETQNYLPRLLALISIIRYPKYFPIKLPNIPNQAYFTAIDLDHQIDLVTAAKLADLDIGEFYSLNPGYNRWATSPHGPYHILLPLSHVDTFQENYSKQPKARQVSWLRHVIQPGDTLSGLATKYQTKMSLIKDVNKLTHNKLRPHHDLLIPKTDKKITQTRHCKKRESAITYAQSVGPKQVIHTVSSHEKFEHLIKKYEVTQLAIQYWNQLAANANLKAGQKLVIWLPRSQKLQGSYEYRVKPGDTLSHIALRHKISTQQLATWNQLKANSLIKPGQDLLIKSDT